ncbi:DUF5990 family protein [Pseudomonas sp. RHF3.3-3]|uniref:DUF5990 family protein n=1 Tax=Pseudomonas TaxID=286 RepID=UPI0006B67162|nr:DUF5990 family protein [Pseudomonas fuscovaginae]
MSDLPARITVVLSCKALPEFEEAVQVGLQDKKQVVHEGVENQAGIHEFTCQVQVRSKDHGQVDFSGPFVHGVAQARFLYLSWRRGGDCATPWVQRVKVPLQFTAADLTGATRLRADITGRKPHAREAVAWQIA